MSAVLVLASTIGLLILAAEAPRSAPVLAAQSPPDAPAGALIGPVGPITMQRVAPSSAWPADPALLAAGNDGQLVRTTDGGGHLGDGGRQLATHAE
jgi:hypothetical protein